MSISPYKHNKMLNLSNYCDISINIDMKILKKVKNQPKVFELRKCPTWNSYHLKVSILHSNQATIINQENIESRIRNSFLFHNRVQIILADQVKNQTGHQKNIQEQHQQKRDVTEQIPPTQVFHQMITIHKTTIHYNPSMRTNEKRKVLSNILQSRHRKI